MKKIQITCNLSCLEDFYIGTGSGSIGLYDDGQLKDRYGRPLINSSTVKGLLRDSCSILDRARQILGLEQSSSYERLFESHANLNSLDIEVRPLEFPERPTIIHFFTSVDNAKRRSRDGSLRSVEFGSRGAVFELHLTYLSRDDETEALVRYLKDGLYNIKAMGGYRRRGFGAVAISGLESSVTAIGADGEVQGMGNRVELLLELGEDTLLSSKAQSGNLLFTNDYIPGSTILGLLRSLALASGCDAGFLDDGNVRSEFFYPLPDGVTDSFATNVCPVPLSLRRLKARKTGTDSTNSIPVWALDMERSGQLSHIISHNLLFDAGEEHDAGKGMYEGWVCADRGDPDWTESRYYTVRKTYHQRNQVDRKTQSTSDNGIFIEERVVAGTRFLGAVTFRDEDSCIAFLAWFQPWLSGAQPVHLGKGGRLAFVRAYRVGTEPAPPERVPAETFTLTLLSDAVLYSDGLAPARTISPEILAGLMGEGFTAADFLAGPSVARRGVVSSFSGTSGLRQFRDVAIRKGSSFSFTYSGAAPALLRSGLGDLEKTGIGSIKDEGFGAIAVDHPLQSLRPVKTQTLPVLGSALISESESARLSALSLRHTQAREYLMKLMKTKPTGSWRSLIGDLIVDLEARKQYADIVVRLQAKCDQDSAQSHWKTTDSRFKLAQVILPWLGSGVDREVLSESLKLLLQDK